MNSFSDVYEEQISLMLYSWYNPYPTQIHVCGLHHGVGKGGKGWVWKFKGLSLGQSLKA